jgi:hypothetical protein
MAFFKEIKGSARFVVEDPDHPYFNCVVAIYDSNRSGVSVAPVGDDGFADKPVWSFHDQLRDLSEPYY